MELEREPGRARTEFSPRWKIDGSFSGYLVIGYTDDLSVLVPEEAYETKDPIFEIIEHERNATYWVREMPTPLQAQQLLEEHGELPEV